MDIRFSKDHHYRLIDESKIETDLSVIYKGQDLELSRTVCVKSIQLDCQNPNQVKPKLNRAMLEVKTMVRVGEKTSRVPRIYSTYFDETSLTLYIIMQWIDGTSLEKKMNVPELMFIRWMIDLCDILAIMERERLYHKDIKPSNIMINRRNELYLIDFNISVSKPNMIEGTVNYKPPEMDMNSKYVGREKVDIFSIGVMLYEYYAKEVPKRGFDYAKNSRRGKLAWDVFKEPISKNLQTPREVNNIVIKCMKMDPRERYRNISELKRDLIQAERSIKKHARNQYKQDKPIQGGVQD
ncbi:MAG: serine/threonine protein kinase [Tissierellaceae bacterium]|nr:protein kinase [Tissierellia bacterium]